MQLPLLCIISYLIVVWEKQTPVTEWKSYSDSSQVQHSTVTVIPPAPIHASTGNYSRWQCRCNTCQAYGIACYSLPFLHIHMQSSAQTGTLRVLMAFQYAHTRQKQLNYLIVLFEQLLLSDWTSILHYLSQCLLENTDFHIHSLRESHKHRVLVFIKIGSPSGDLWSFIIQMMLIRWTWQWAGWHIETDIQLNTATQPNTSSQQMLLWQKKITITMSPFA